jgi:uncharacterized radical SAM protein YgiQ
MNTEHKFLPTSADEMKQLGWEQADVILVSGDAYVDQPAFGTAVMARLGESLGLKVAVLPQPNWRDDLRDFKKLGKPRYFFGVTAGCMDSMVNHYTARKRLRSDDAYTPGGRYGYRPDYATIVYAKILKSIFPDVPVLLGGIEASLRRLTHYDFWSDNLKPSVLIESCADMILYGMAERPFINIIQQLKNGVLFQHLENIPQTVVSTEEKPLPASGVIDLPSHEDCLKDKQTFAKMFAMAEKESNRMNAERLIQKYQDQYIIVQPPFLPATTEETDLSFDLPYTRLPHPRYKKKPPIPAFEMIRNSVTIHRGCFGGCSFCAISAHQGKFIASRSEQSVLREIEQIASSEDFRGHITDLGGPSANMYQMKGINLKQCELCCRPSCIFPEICKNLNFDHHPLTELYNSVQEVKNVRLVTVGSGIRYDMLVDQPPKTDKEYGLTLYSKKLVNDHISGRLKVAPEHISEEVLKIMRKPSFQKFRSFHRIFHHLNKSSGKNQQLRLYLIADHPGSKDSDMKMLSQAMHSMGYQIEAVQEFTPTPMTLSSVIYYTGIHPFTGKKIEVPDSNSGFSKQKNILMKKGRRK